MFNVVKCLDLFCLIKNLGSDEFSKYEMYYV